MYSNFEVFGPVNSKDKSNFEDCINKEEIISLLLNAFIYNRGTPETQYTYIDAFEKGQFLSQSELSERVGLPEEMANLPELCRAVSPVQVFILVV